MTTDSVRRAAKRCDPALALAVAALSLAPPAALAASTPLADTRYHLLALGNKRYPHYCAYGHTLDRELKRLGAATASPLATVDNLDPKLRQAER